MPGPSPRSLLYSRRVAGVVTLDLSVNAGAGAWIVEENVFQLAIEGLLCGHGVTVHEEDAAIEDRACGLGGVSRVLTFNGEVGSSHLLVIAKEAAAQFGNSACRNVAINGIIREKL